MIKFYVSKTNNSLNRRPWSPEFISNHICLNPSRTVKLRRNDLKILLDSGAFQDVDSNKRLTFEEALKRQLEYEKKCGFIAERIVSYDRLVDEQLDDEGRKIKRRVGEADGWDYVRDTIAAARYLASQRELLKPRQLVLSCQGTTVEQYLYCVQQVLEIAKPGDCIGMGGFCIVGSRPALQRQFYEIQEKTLPLLKEAGITDVHLFGVTAVPVLQKWVELSKSFELNLSIDSSAFERRSVFGAVFNPDLGKWEQKYSREDKYINYHPRDLALVNTANGIDFIQQLA